MNKNVKSLILLLVVLAILLGGGYFVYSRYAVKTEPPKNTEITDKEGEPLRDFTVFDAEHNELRAADLAGKPAIINFWASWCPPCCAELPFFDSAWAAHGDRIRFVMINLADDNSETPTAIKSFLEENGYRFPVYYDLNADAANAYAINSIPMTLFVDKNGNVIDSHLGMLSESVLDTMIQTLTGEE